MLLGHNKLVIFIYAAAIFSKRGQMLFELSVIEVMYQRKGENSLAIEIGYLHL